MATSQVFEKNDFPKNGEAIKETGLTENNKDEKAMTEDAVLLDLPDVTDIPGQENITPPRMGMFADTTISSDGEEGTAVFDDDENEEL